MKVLKSCLIIFLCFIAMACSSDPEEPEVIDTTDDEVVVEEEMEEEEEDEEPESLTDGLTIIGLLRNQMTGLFEVDPQQHIVTNEFSLESIDVQNEVGIPQGDRPFYHISQDGIVFINDEINPNSGFREEFPYYKGFDGSLVNTYPSFTTANSLLSFGDFQGNIWGVYYDFETYNDIEDSYEYFVKIVDSNDFSERVLNLGRFNRNGTFQVKQSNRYVYVYYALDFQQGDDASLLVIDLNTLNVVSNQNDLVRNRFTLVNDENDNCYLFSSGLSYLFNVNSTSLQELNFSFDTAFLSNIFLSNEVDAIVQDNKLLAAAPGIQPGPQLFVPAVFDLNSGELTSYDFSQETIQLESDTFEWNPVHRAITFDSQEGYFYLGVSSSGLSPANASDAILVIDFEGNILEMAKVPISPIRIIR